MIFPLPVSNDKPDYDFSNLGLTPVIFTQEIIREFNFSDEKDRFNCEVVL